MTKILRETRQGQGLLAQSLGLPGHADREPVYRSPGVRDAT